MWIRLLASFGMLVGLAMAQAQQYVISTVVGGRPVPSPAPALRSSIGGVSAVAAGSNGDFYFATVAEVFKVDENGILTTVAGNGKRGYSGDGGPAVDAQLYMDRDSGMAVDASGNVYVADLHNYRVRKITPAGFITTVAGTGVCGFSGDNGPASVARICNPTGLAVDGAGNLYLADAGNARIRKLTPGGMITTVAGNGEPGDAGNSQPGEGRPAVEVSVGGPRGLAIDPAGNLYIADSNYNLVRKVTPNGIMSIVPGSQFSGQANAGQVVFAVGVDAAGNLYVGDSANYRIRRVTATGTSTVIAGTGEIGYSGDGGPAVSARLGFIAGVVLDSAGNLYVADESNRRVRKVATTGTIVTVAGDGTDGYSGDEGPAAAARLRRPSGMALDSSGNVYIADEVNSVVRKISAAGIITTVAGNGTSGYSGDGGPATSATLNRPHGLALDSSGNLYIADLGNFRVRKIARTGVITTVAGNGAYGQSGNGGPAIQATLGGPLGLAVDSAGELYIAGNGPLRKVSRTGEIAPVPGLTTSDWVVADGSGNLYVADAMNSVVRKVSAGGVVTTIAGDGAPGYSGDGGPATGASLGWPQGLALDASGNLFIADTNNSRIRRVSTNGVITTVAGNGKSGYSGDGGPAVSAALRDPVTVAADSAGNLFIADTLNDAIRFAQLGSGTTPLISSDGVVSGASFLPGIAPGSWVTVRGSNLASTTRTWAAADFAGGSLPTKLDGVSVDVNGRPAYVYFISPTQVNVLSPDDPTEGMAPVQITTAQGKSNVVMAAMRAFAPALFTFSQQDGKYVAAVRADGSYVAPPNLVSGLITQPAKPGDTLLFFGTGFGPTTPRVPIGQVVNAAPLANQVTVRIGGVVANIHYAGVVSPGLCQFNVVVPDVANGDNSVLLEIGGRASQAGVFVAVQR